MPNLGDYLGQLLSEISMARLQADLETVRLAELYAAHPLLKAMPVPRVRLPEVDIDLPLLIEASDEPRPGETTRGGAGAREMAGAVDQLMAAHLSRSNVKLSRVQRTRLRAALDAHVAALDPPAETGIDTRRLADGLTDAGLRSLSSGSPSNRLRLAIQFETTGGDLREAVRRELLKLRTPPPRLHVLVTSAELREQGNAANMARLKLKVSEQGMEWVAVEVDGAMRDQLAPE